ncbi:RNA pseudouridine synthase 1 [Platanthera guangdongensis]|uniref:RNA pseudouridine synthase 1 n=1 Tax=Platanthera guangdongensis TaxID=2320717 RepID=A0ABR2MU13_9ASPA
MALFGAVKLVANVTYINYMTDGVFLQKSSEQKRSTNELLMKSIEKSGMRCETSNAWLPTGIGIPAKTPGFSKNKKNAAVKTYPSLVGFLQFSDRSSRSPILPPIMASADSDSFAGGGHEDTKPAGGYPSPIAPPYPALSKAMELHRAMSATVRSGTFALSSKDIIFEDDWLVVVNKPSGIYCETILSSLSSLPVSEFHPANEQK